MHKHSRANYDRKYKHMTHNVKQSEFLDNFKAVISDSFKHSSCLDTVESFNYNETIGN